MASDASVSNNPFEDWNPDLSRLRKMKHVRLSGAGLAGCPTGLGKVDKLETLDLSDNSIGVLDPASAGLFKLTTLKVRNNRITVSNLVVTRV